MNFCILEIGLNTIAGMDYNPKEWNWRDHFIDGHCNPFSERYEYLVHASGFVIRAKETFKPGQIRMPS